MEKPTDARVVRHNAIMAVLLVRVLAQEVVAEVAVLRDVLKDAREVVCQIAGSGVLTLAYRK